MNTEQKLVRQSQIVQSAMYSSGTLIPRPFPLAEYDRTETLISSAYVSRLFFHLMFNSNL